MTRPDALEPEASVVIPAYNAERTLDAQLSALEQQADAPPHEILVCDNGSTDGTAALVRRWTRSHPHIRLIDASRRRGPSAARNVGAAAATTESVLFCDADDRVMPGWITAMTRGLEVASIVVGGFREPAKRPHFRATPPWRLHMDGPIYKGVFPALPAGGSGNMAVRRNDFLSVGGFDESFRAGEDIDLCWRLQLSGHRLAFARDSFVASGPQRGVLAIFRQSRTHGLGDQLLAARYAPLAAERLPRREPEYVGSILEWEDAATLSSAVSSPGRIAGRVAWALGQRVERSSKRAAEAVARVRPFAPPTSG